MYLAAPIVFAIYQYFPPFLRQSTFLGLPVVVLAIILSSFATNVWHLILTQGVLYAIGGSLLYYPIFIFIDEWFIRRKGFAFGVMWAGSGTGGLAGPLVLNWGLSRYGPRTFLKGWAIAFVSEYQVTSHTTNTHQLILAGPMLYFVKPRLPLLRSRQTPSVRFTDGYNFLKTRTFWILQAGNIAQGLGYFIPGLYLPSYARTINLSPLESSLLVSLLNTASVPGIVLLSALSDRTNVTNVIFISALGSTLSVFCFWGLASSMPLLAIFTIFYGFFAGGFTATYAGMFMELRRAAPGSDLGSIIGLLGAGRGIGNVVCGPLSELLLRGSKQHENPKFAYNSSYGGLVVFTGVTAALTVTPFVLRRLRLM
jgi:MFS family permease